VEAADFTDGGLSPAFSLSSSRRAELVGFFIDPKPLKSGMSVRDSVGGSGARCWSVNGLFPAIRFWEGVSGALLGALEAPIDGLLVGSEDFSFVIFGDEGAVLSCCRMDPMDGLLLGSVGFSFVVLGVEDAAAVGCGSSVLDVGFCKDETMSEAAEPGGAFGFDFGVVARSSEYVTGSVAAGRGKVVGGADVTEDSSGMSASGSTVDAPPFRLFGPFARPFRMSCNWPPSADGSEGGLDKDAVDRCAIAGLSGLDDGLEPLGCGGPRASMLASPGLNREAILLVSVACLACVAVIDGALLAAGALVCFSSSGIATSGLGFTLRLLCRASASGVAVFGFSGLVGALMLSALPSTSRLANASGFCGVCG